MSLKITNLKLQLPLPAVDELIMIFSVNIDHVIIGLNCISKSCSYQAESCVGF